MELEYLGSNRYRVVKNQNSKMREGDEFEASSFIQGFPMYVSHIERDGDETSMYVAGFQDGLTLVERVKGC